MGVCMAILLAFYHWRRHLKVKRVFKGNYMSLRVGSKAGSSQGSPEGRVWVALVDVHCGIFFSGWDLEARARHCPQLWPPPPIWAQS